MFTCTRLFSCFLLALQGIESAQIHLPAVTQVMVKKPSSSTSLFTEKHVWDFVRGTSERVSLPVRGARLQHSSYQLSPHQRNSSQLLIRCQNSLQLHPFAQHNGVDTRRKNEHHLGKTVQTKQLFNTSV